MPKTYFARTECVAGVRDMRFQQLMPDVFHWLGITRIDRWASMSDMKHGALVEAGIEVVERVPIPDELIPADAESGNGRQARRVLLELHARQKELAEAKGTRVGSMSAAACFAPGVMGKLSALESSFGMSSERSEGSHPFAK